MNPQGAAISPTYAAPVQAQVKQAEVQTQEAQESLQRLLVGTRVEEIAAAQAQANAMAQQVRQSQVALLQAQLRAKNSTQNAQRFATLYQQEFVSHQEYDNAQTEADVAKREVQRLNTELLNNRALTERATAQLAESRHGPIRQEISQARASKQYAHANVQFVQAQPSH